MRADICQLLPCKPSKPSKPSMAEIERLVDALVDAALYSDIQDTQAARAALLAAIRAVLK